MTVEVTPQVQTQSRAETAIRANAPLLLAYFERRCAYEEAADLLGETLMTAWRRADATPLDDREARMWLFGIARRVLSTSKRAGVRRQALVDRLREDAHTAASDTRREDDELYAALATLTELDAEIIRLRHWDGFNLAEIAELLGRRPGTIRSRYSRALTALRLALETEPTHE